MVYTGTDYRASIQNMTQRRDYRVEQLAKFRVADGDALGAAKFRGLLACLTRGELASFVSISLKTELTLPLRESVAMSIKTNLDAEFNEEYKGLLDALIAATEQGGFRMQQRAAIMLELVSGSENIDKIYQSKIVSSLMRSSLRSHRNRGYKIASTMLPLIPKHILLQNWRIHQDYKAIELMTAVYSALELDELYDELLNATQGTQQYEYIARKLYFAAPLNDSRLNDIRQLDGITYSVVCAKRHIPMSDDTARDLWRRHNTDQRAQLLIWSFGQCGLWDTILKLDLPS